MAKKTIGDALHRACLQQEKDEVHRLLTDIKPAALNKKLTDYASPLQGTPLHIACQTGNLDIVKLLVEAGQGLRSICWSKALITGARRLQNRNCYFGFAAWAALKL